jgi:voltage-gated potassium channel
LSVISFREKVRQIIFEADTTAGKAFDEALLVCIVASVVAVMLDSIHGLHAEYGGVLYIAEWFFTVVFTVEYVLRLWCVGRPKRYARSFYGIVDLLAIVPTYLSLFFVGSQYLLVIRLLRVLRVFRVLKIVHFVSEAGFLVEALRASARKIIVFMLAVVILVVIFGSLMYVVEGGSNGYTSIPKSVYWAVVTLTTVGYGDIAPQTPLGQALASVIMIIGYAIIAVPTGIVTAEMSLATLRMVTTRACRECSAEGHAPDAVFCKFCGAKF